jgi:tRNA G18 (ribose-2'-O)-methylase SpoU
MLTVRKIDSFDLPGLQPYRTMRRQTEQREQGIFVAEGEKVVRRLLESRLAVVSVLMPEKWLRELRPLLEARAEQVQVFVAEKALLETLTGFSMYQGLLAVGKVPTPAPLEEILACSAKPRLLVAVEGLSSAENLGALVRNCAAFNVQALLVGETSGSPFLRRAVRSSMGTVFRLPIVELPGRAARQPAARSAAGSVSGRVAASTQTHAAPETLVEALAQLSARGFRCIAAHPHVTGRVLSQADFIGDCCIVFGSEGYGLSVNVLKACQDAVAIPMPPTVDSLNVGSAAAVFLYEASRQRGVERET